METYGKTIRTIRLNKGISQKELYSGLISKSYAVNFEKGLHEPSIGLMNHILNRLSMQFEEFFFIHQGYRESLNQDFNQRQSLAINQGNRRQLEQLVIELNQLHGDFYQVIAAETRIHLDFLASQAQPFQQIIDNQPDFNSKDIQIIQRYLLRLDSWTLTEIKLFASNQFIFDSEAQLSLRQICQKKLEAYHNHSEYNEIYATLLINSLSILLNQENYPDAKKALSKLTELTSDPLLGTYRLLTQYFQAIYQVLHGETEIGRKAAERKIVLLNELDYQHLAKNCQLYLQFVLYNQK